MSKRCPECRNINDDSRLFCSACGAALDAQVRLIQNLEKQKDSIAKDESDTPRGELKFYNSSSSAPKKRKSSPLPWILLGLAVVAVAAWFFLK